MLFYLNMETKKYRSIQITLS